MRATARPRLPSVAANSTSTASCAEGASRSREMPFPEVDVTSRGVSEKCFRIVCAVAQLAPKILNAGSPSL